MARLFGVYFLEKYTARLKQVCSNILKNCPNPASKQCLPNIALENFFPISNAFVAVGPR
jgi:hypothetical protein